MKTVLDEVEELNRDRFVQPEAGIDALHIGIDSTIAEHGACGIAWQEPHEDECDDEDKHHGRDHLENATQNEAEKWQAAPDLL